MVAYAYTPITWEPDAGGLPLDWGQPGLYTKTLAQKTKEKEDPNLTKHDIIKTVVWLQIDSNNEFYKKAIGMQTPQEWPQHVKISDRKMKV